MSSGGLEVADFQAARAALCLNQGDHQCRVPAPKDVGRFPNTIPKQITKREAPLLWCNTVRRCSRGVSESSRVRDEEGGNDREVVLGRPYGFCRGMRREYIAPEAELGDERVLTLVCV